MSNEEKDLIQVDDNEAAAYIQEQLKEKVSTWKQIRYSLLLSIITDTYTNWDWWNNSKRTGLLI